MSDDQRHSKRPHFPSGVIFGFFLIFLGVAFILHNMELIDIVDALYFSPCVLIAFGLAAIWNKGIFNVWGHLQLVGGAVLQMGVLGYRAVETWWPILIIWVGLLVSIRAVMPKKKPKLGSAAQSDDEQWHWQTDKDDVLDAQPISINVDLSNEDGKNE